MSRTASLERLGWMEQMELDVQRHLGRRLCAFLYLGFLALVTGDLTFQVLRRAEDSVLITVLWLFILLFIWGSKAFLMVRRLRQRDVTLIPLKARSWGEYVVTATLGQPVLFMVLALGVLLLVGTHSTIVGRIVGLALITISIVGTRSNVRAIQRALHFRHVNEPYPSTRWEAADLLH